MEVATAEMPNRIITEGLIEDYEIKDSERFTRGCTMTQCFNCQKYGHTGRSCRNPAACGHCAGRHQSKECNLETTGQYRRCAVCGEKGHEACSTACKIRKAEKRKLKLLCKIALHYTQASHSRPHSSFKERRHLQLLKRTNFRQRGRL